MLCYFAGRYVIISNKFQINQVCLDILQEKNDITENGLPTLLSKISGVQKRLLYSTLSKIAETATCKLGIKL